MFQPKKVKHHTVIIIWIAEDVVHKGPNANRHRLGIGPFRTAVPFRRQTTWNLSDLFPKRDCYPLKGLTRTTKSSLECFLLTRGTPQVAHFGQTIFRMKGRSFTQNRRRYVLVRQKGQSSCIPRSWGYTSTIHCDLFCFFSSQLLGEL